MVNHITKPQVIHGPGFYQTRSGEIVQVTRLLNGGAWYEGFYQNGTRELWDKSGRLLPYTECGNDIVNLFRI